MSVKNILLITNAYPDTSHPSHGIFIQELAERLSRSDCNISVLSPLITPPQDELPIPPNIHVYRFRSWTHGKRLIELGAFEKCLIPLYVVSCVTQALKIIKMSHIDIIHAHWIYPSGLIARILKRLTRVPFVLTSHGTDWRMGHKNKIIKRLTYHIFRQAKLLTVVSEVMLKKLNEFGDLKHKSIFFPDGIDTHTFKPIFQETGAPEKKIKIISTRNFYPIYQVHLLLNMLPALLRAFPSIELTLIGSGPLQREYTDFIQKKNLKDHVRLLGPIQHSEMPRYLHQSNIYVSTSPYDGTSVSLLEAMACGCYPVVTKIPENSCWITHGLNGCLFDSNNPESLEKTLSLAVSSKEQWSSAKKTNWDIIQHKADWNNHITKLTSAYSELNSF
ncbi:glycosyltransferase [PVC group bacterium]|nr:glycosyltransferase [PVC group bacterium]